jgi:hypothetical protein
MGITESEYREILAVADSTRIRPVARAELRIQGVARGWRIEGGKDLPELQVIEVDTIAGEVRTPFGRAANVEQIIGSARQTTTGPWDGVQWQRVDPTMATGEATMITFALGRLQGSGRGLLYYDAKQVSGGVLRARAMRVLTFNSAR